MVASTLSEDPLEEVAAEFGETPGFFQLYCPTDPEVAASLVQRAEAAGRPTAAWPPSTAYLRASAGDYSRSILRSPCAGVHHSTTSIVAFSLRWVCTTSAMSA